MRRASAALLVASTLFALALACGGEPVAVDLAGPTAEWPEYGGDMGGLRWSPLEQVTRENVAALEIAWTYRHGDISDGSDGSTRFFFNATATAEIYTLSLRDALPI